MGPGLLREIVVSTISVEQDMRLVGPPVDPARLEAAVDEHEPDVLLVSANGGARSSAAERMLFRRPGLRVVTIGEHGRDTRLTELRPHTEALGNLSPADLVAAIRRAVRAERRGC
jgi:hypothetical protein